MIRRLPKHSMLLDNGHISKSSSVIHVIVSGFLLLGLALLCVAPFMITSFLYVPDAPASTKSPPLYPGAEDVRSRKEHDFPGTQIQIVTFQTHNDPLTVSSFYKDVLAKDGWKILRDSQSMQYYRYVLIGGGGPDSDPEYSFEVQTKGVSSGKTETEVILVSYPSR
jgi:hypothetical protein